MFKPGDSVVCVTCNPRSSLVVGNLYTVDKDYRGGDGDYYVRVREVHILNHSYHHTRFKLAEISLENK